MTRPKPEEKRKPKHFVIDEPPPEFLPSKVAAEERERKARERTVLESAEKEQKQD